LVGWQEGHPACKKLSGGALLSAWARCRVVYSPADATATYRLFASVKSRSVLPLWYRLTRVVPDKGPRGGSSANSDERMVRWICGIKLKDRFPSKELRER